MIQHQAVCVYKNRMQYSWSQWKYALITPLRLTDRKKSYRNTLMRTSTLDDLKELVRKYAHSLSCQELGERRT